MSDPTTLALVASAGAFLVNSGLTGWVIWSMRRIARDEVEASAARTANAIKETVDALRVHDTNPMAHANHYVTQQVQKLQLEVVSALAEMKAEIKMLHSEVSSLRRSQEDMLRGRQDQREGDR